jgi:putative Holliday junction resolvase
MVMAFDYGLRRIGVALGNTLTCGASPVGVIWWSRRNERDAALQKMVKEWQPDELVIGLPVDVEGKEHEMTRVCKHFAEHLVELFNKPVHLVDERYSSQVLEVKEGKKPAKGRDADSIDAQAAAVILQQYFDTNIKSMKESEST